MRIGTYVSLGALALALTLASPGSASQEGNRGSERETTRQEQSSDKKESKDSQESKHGSCEKLCLADGEDPLDCEQYCVQVVAR